MSADDNISADDTISQGVSGTRLSLILKTVMMVMSSEGHDSASTRLVCSLHMSLSLVHLAHICWEVILPDPVQTVQDCSRLLTL